MNSCCSEVYHTPCMRVWSMAINTSLQPCTDFYFIEEYIVWPFKFCWCFFSLWTEKTVMKMSKSKRDGRSVWAVRMPMSFESMLWLWSFSFIFGGLLIITENDAFIYRFISYPSSSLSFVDRFFFDAWIMGLFCAHLRSNTAYNTIRNELFIWISGDTLLNLASDSAWPSI